MQPQGDGIKVIKKINVALNFVIIFLQNIG